MSKEESLPLRIFNIVFGVITAVLLCYFIAENYVAYWYLKDHHKTTTCKVVGVENFADGGNLYRYEYVVDGIQYSETSLPRDYKKPPEIGQTYFVDYLAFWPSVSKADF